MDLDAADTHVRSRLTLRRNPVATGLPPLELAGRGFELESLVLDGRRLSPAQYQQTEAGLRIATVPADFVLEAVTRLNPAANSSLEGLYQSGTMLCTQCEAHGFSRITYFIDRPDVLSRYRVTLQADRGKYPVLLANGNPVAQGEASEGRHWVTWEDPFPKPCYLFAMVAGDLVRIEDRFRTVSGRDIALHIYVEPENRALCAHALASLKAAMRWDEQAYGREYDLDLFMIVAVSSFNMGAMENKGLNIFNSRYVLVSPETATDQDYEAVRDVVAHEYFHNWTGNRVTCRDWFQLSLKEGLTVFREQQFSSSAGSADSARIQEARLIRTQQFAEDAGPMSHPVRPESYVEINNFYTLTVYEKGAEVIRMLHTLLGAALFRRGMDLYFERHDGQAVTIEDFVAAMEVASERDLTQFRHWYRQAGTPVVTAEGCFDASRKEYRLTLRQSCVSGAGERAESPHHIPVSTRLLARNGRALCEEQVLELRAAEQEFVFGGLQEPPVPVLLGGFSAPVRFECHYSEPELRAIVSGEADGYSRWDAMQQLFLAAIARGMQAWRSGQAPIEEHDLGGLLQTLLSSVGADTTLLAELMQLPSEEFIAEQQAELDVDALVNARDRLRRNLAQAMQDVLLDRYRALSPPGPWEFTPQEVGRRRLRNGCLAWLAALDDGGVRRLCLEQYRRADNMTDRMVALQCLNQQASAERDNALFDFYTRSLNQPLVLDKWFTLQAVSPVAGAAARIRTLREHALFDERVPNRVRAVFSSFASQNMRGFHQPDGSGYRLIADQVLALDGFNPQVAARLVTSLASWRRVHHKRSELMKVELERLAAARLSADVREIVTKSLAVT